MNFVPKACFLTSGVGVHREKLGSFEWALRNAQIAEYNLVKVSSIFPPACEWTSIEDGKKLLNPGQIVFCVLSENYANKPGMRVGSGVGVAYPESRNHHGYMYELHNEGEPAKKVAELSEQLACELLATSLGIKDYTWSPDSDEVKLEGETLIKKAVGAESEHKEEGLWTCTLAAAIFVL